MGKICKCKKHQFSSTVKSLKQKTKNIKAKSPILTKKEKKKILITIASEKSLAKDWNSKEDEEAWKNL